MTSMEHPRAPLPWAVGAEEMVSRAKRGEQFAEGARLEKPAGPLQQCMLSLGGCFFLCAGRGSCSW